MENALENETVNTSMPANGKRLDSWKEIAFYLERDVRTVQRWEKQEGLPIHRHLHEKSGTVYAFSGELDEWLKGRRVVSNNTSEISETEPKISTEIPENNMRRITVTILLVALVLGGAVIYLVNRSKNSSDLPANQRIKLAVLPFDNLEGETEQNYFSDGMTEEIITQLARLDPEKLGVIGRTSVMHYKGTSKDITTIGQELNVDYILEGSVRRDANQIRVTAQLIKVKDQTHLWADTYNRDVPDVLSVQTEIAKHIAESLMPRLLPDKFSAANQITTKNTEAYELYLKGLYALNRGTTQTYQQSIEFFEKASESDPNFALSYVGLAEAYAMMGSKGMRSGEECFPKAEEAVLKALTLNNNLAEAHSVLAMIKFYWSWDSDSAEREFLRALELNPTIASAHHEYAHFLSFTGRHDEALKEMLRAQELEPLSAAINSDAGWIYFQARRYDEAIAECRKVLELEPNFPSAQDCIISSLRMKGVYEEARQEKKRALEKINPNIEATGINDPDPQKALQSADLWQIENLGRMDSKSYVSPLYKAYLYAFSGDVDHSFECLQIAYKAHDPRILQLNVSPVFDVLKHDPRFNDLVMQIKNSSSN